MCIYSVYAHHSQSRFSEMEGSLRLEGNLMVTRQVIEIATRAIFISFTHIMIARWLLNEVSINTIGRPYFSTGEQLKYLQYKDAMSMTKTTQVHVWMWCRHTYRRHIDAVLYRWDASRMDVYIRHLDAVLHRCIVDGVAWMNVYVVHLYAMDIAISWLLISIG